MMHGCASVSEAPRRGPILLCGMKAMLQRAGDRRLEPSSAIRYVRIKPKLSDPPVGDGALDLASSSGRFDHAGRMTIPSGTTPSCTSPHKAISSLRASATIMVLREPLVLAVRSSNHLTSGLSF